MDLGPQSLSLFVSLILILGAMGVALIVDLLKGNNEQLRELAIELKAKKDAAEKHLEALEVHTSALLRQPALLAASAPAATNLLPENPGSEAATPALPRQAPAAARTQSNAVPFQQAGAPVKTEEAGFHATIRKTRDENQTKREMSPAVAAVAESVAARMAAGKMSPAQASIPVNDPVAAPEPARASVTPAAPPPFVSPSQIIPGPNSNEEGISPEIVPVEVRTGMFKTPKEFRKDWSRILTSKKQDGAPAGDTAENPIPALAPAAGDDNLIQFEAIRVPAAAVVVEDTKELPAGYHEYSILRKAAALGVTLQGMVVSIGTNPLEASQMNEVSKFVKSLLEGDDFGCQSGTDEFVVVCVADPQSAQRRLSTIAEKLWDFQLRSMGQLNVQFAWGGMESRKHDPLNDVVAAAVDQMTETRRARRGSTTVQVAQAV